MRSSFLCFQFFFLCYYFLLLCCVAFIKVLTIHQTYYTWMHCLYHSPLSPTPHSWNSFYRDHFYVFTHMYTVFPPYLLFYTLSVPPPPSHWYQPPTHTPGRTCSALLFSNLERREKKKWYFWLFKTVTQGVFLWHCIYVL
jgi:hypothetical protein